MIDIKHKFTGDLLRQINADTLVDADLVAADLSVADLAGVNLSCVVIMAGITAAVLDGYVWI